jgi:uncharacterized hydrophobic protein (TIGR00271 family)
MAGNTGMRIPWLGAVADPPLADARLSLGPATLDDLFPEGAAFRRSTQTFVVLLTLAGFIATFGLYQDSVAAIIGAMVVAPLGGTIMAFAGALVTARFHSQRITFVEVVLGALLVIAIGFGVSLLVPDPLTLNPSLDARTAPGLFDLGVALAAGAAGAYVAVRRTGTDALPGVAIAVSLVPPLATVGICLELGRLDDAAGAGLLFLTNFAAITVSACVVFLLSGAAPTTETPTLRQKFRFEFLVAIVALIVISLPLVWRASQNITNTVNASNGAPIVKAWIGDRDLQVRSWLVDGGDVTLHLVGTDIPGSATDLATSLAGAFGSPVVVHIDYDHIEKIEGTGAPG